MKIYIRHQGNIVAEADLEEGREYTIGRLPESDIRIAQDFISRQHARLYFSEGHWWYRDLREKKAREMVPKSIDDSQPIIVEKSVDLVTPGYLTSQRTQEIDARQDLQAFAERPPAPEPSLMSRKPILFSMLTVGLVAVLAAAGFFIYRQWFQPMNATELLTFVRPKVVELEETPDPEIIAELKQYAKFKDDDFRQSFGFCSGFIVAKNVVLTASHCVFGPYGTDIHEDFVIKTHDQKTHKPSRILGFDILHDYLYLEVPGLESYGSLALEPKYQIGERVYTIGNVLGQGIAIREGITASKTKDESDPTLEFLRYSAAASPGNSGGPLVNARGKVIGLVFARSGFSENYNMATDARDLKDGYARFVDKRDAKKVVIRLDKIPAIFQHDLFGALGPPPGGESETQKSEAAPIEVTVPATVADAAKVIGDGMEAFTHKRLNATNFLEGILGGLDQDGKTQWTDQATEETPLILPYPQYDRINIVRAGPDYFVPDAISLFRPADQASYDLFKTYLKEQNQYVYQARQEEALLRNKEMRDLQMAEKMTGPFHYDSGLDGDLRYLDAFMPDIDIRLDLDRAADWQARRLPSDDERRRMILGEKGLNIPSYFSDFLKPDRAHEIVLTDLPKPEVSEIQDDLGRSWAVQTWTLFKDIRISQNCLPLPEGSLCFSKTQYGLKGPKMGDTPDAKQLAQVMVQPAFWHLPALSDYRARGYAKNLNGMDDVAMDEAPNGDLQIRLLTLGVSFQIPAPAKPKMIRIVPALYHRGGQTKWIAVGYSGYFPAANAAADAAKFCGADVLIDGLPPYADSVGRPPFPGNKPLEVKKFTVKSLQKDATVVPFCQAVGKDGPYYRFENYQPYAVNYTTP